MNNEQRKKTMSSHGPPWFIWKFRVNSFTSIVNSMWHANQRNEAGAGGVSKRMKGPWTAWSPLESQRFAGQCPVAMGESLKTGWERTEIMSTGISLRRKKKICTLLKQKMRGGPHKEELFDFMTWGRTWLRDSEMSYFSKDASPEPRLMSIPS